MGVPDLVVGRDSKQDCSSGEGGAIGASGIGGAAVLFIVDRRLREGGGMGPNTGRLETLARRSTSSRFVSSAMGTKLLLDIERRKGGIVG